MGNNPAVTVIAVVVLIVAAVFIVRSFTGSDVPQAGNANWYDTGTGKLFGGYKMGEAEDPPIKLPSGGEGVMARVFTRGTCENQADRYIGFLFKYTEEGKDLMKKARAEDILDIDTMAFVAQKHRLVKGENDTEWFPADSIEGQEILGSTRGVRACETFLP